METTDEKKQNILVLEDERPLAEAIRAKLSVSGFDVVCARTVPQALEYLEELGSVDAVWLDHYLFGKESGLDFVAQLKAPDSDWKEIPVFVVSNTASPDKVQSYLKFGINKYYVKSDHRLDVIIEDIKKAIAGNTS